MPIRPDAGLVKARTPSSAGAGAVAVWLLGSVPESHSGRSGFPIRAGVSALRRYLCWRGRGTGDLLLAGSYPCFNQAGGGVESIEQALGEAVGD
jgi:hypothetical protein